MREWTREERYTKLSDVKKETYDELYSGTMNSKWRQKYHIQPPTGLLNDPNGFTYYKGKYRLFYQWFPLGPVHGIKYWYAVESEDLATFKELGPALSPDTTYDSHGVYSGSGIVVNDELKVIYTGNHRDADWRRIPYQMIAGSSDGLHFKKEDEPVISGAPEGYTEHFRDPKVWYEHGKYYMVIGAQRENETGAAVVYESNDYKQWTFASEIKTEYDDFGYMWECPDVFELDGNDILMFCPQGVDKYGDKFWNIYQSGYLIGELNKETFEMTHGEFIELDNGFDFYAPQTTLSPEGERILIGWMGLPDTGYPTDEEGWAHCLTLPRKLTVEHGKLRQRPIDALKKLRGNVETAEGYATRRNVKLHPYEGDCYELIVDVLENESPEFYIELRVSKKESTMFTYNKEERRLTLDRFDSGQDVTNVDGTSRSVVLEEDLHRLQFFVDESSIELFINDGEKVMTTRIFPSKEATGIRTSTLTGQVYFRFTKYEINV